MCCILQDSAIVEEHKEKAIAEVYIRPFKKKILMQSHYRKLLVCAGDGGGYREECLRR